VCGGVSNARLFASQYYCTYTISISQKKQSRQLIINFLNGTNQTIIPPHLSFNKENLIGIVNNIVNRQWVGLNLNELLIVEYYSRKV
jgi:small subunit ribosomal protein S4